LRKGSEEYLSLWIAGALLAPSLGHQPLQDVSGVEDDWFEPRHDGPVDRVMVGRHDHQSCALKYPASSGRDSSFDPFAMKGT
jgi:hypothetical protein